MERKFILAGSIFMIIAVVFGALGAHALKEILNPEQLGSFETGVRYQVYHALALLIFSQVNLGSLRTQKLILYGFVAGILLFSFSIYGLVLSPLVNLHIKFLGPVTPIGGLLLIITWGFIIFKSLKYKAGNN